MSLKKSRRFTLFLMCKCILILTTHSLANGAASHDADERPQSAEVKPALYEETGEQVPSPKPVPAARPSHPSSVRPNSPEVRFNENDTLYKMIQRNLDAAKNLREFLETGVKKPNVNYNYWVYHKGRRGGYYAEVDPTVLGKSLNAQTQLNGALKELETRINELKSRNIRPADALLLNRVVQDVQNVIYPGLKRVEEAVLNSGIVVPHADTTTPVYEILPKEFSKPKTIDIKDYPKVKEADGHFEGLKKKAAEIDLLDKKIAQTRPGTRAGETLLKARDEATSKFLEVYSDLMALKDYHSYSVVSDLPKFEERFKKIVEAQEQKKSGSRASETVESERTATASGNKSNAKAAARDEINGLRSQIIKTLHEKPRLGKVAEFEFRETLDRLKKLEEALMRSEIETDEDLLARSQEETKRRTQGDTDSRWMANLEEAIVPLSENMDSSLNNHSKETEKNTVGDDDPRRSREEKRKFVESLAGGPLTSGEERISTFEGPLESPGIESQASRPAGSNSRFLDGTELTEKTRQTYREEAQENPDYETESLNKRNSSLGNRDPKKINDKSSDSEMPTWVKSFMNEFRTVKTAFSNYLPGLKSGALNGGDLETGKSGLKAPVGDNDSIATGSSTAIGNENNLEFNDDELGFSLRNQSDRRKVSGGSSKIRKDDEGTSGNIVSLSSNNTNYVQSPNSNNLEPTNKSKKVETYAQNSDGTWSPVNPQGFKKRNGGSKGEPEVGDVSLISAETMADKLEKVGEPIEAKDLEGLQNEAPNLPENPGDLKSWGGGALDSIGLFLAQIYEDSRPEALTDISELMAPRKNKKAGFPIPAKRQLASTKAVLSDNSNGGVFAKIKSWLGLN